MGRGDPETLAQCLLNCLKNSQEAMDVATGKAAGTLTAGVASGRVGLEELRKAAPDFLAADVGALLDVVLR